MQEGGLVEIVMDLCLGNGTKGILLHELLHCLETAILVSVSYNHSLELMIMYNITYISSVLEARDKESFLFGKPNDLVRLIG